MSKTRYTGPNWRVPVAYVTVIGLVSWLAVNQFPAIPPINWLKDPVYIRPDLWYD